MASSRIDRSKIKFAPGDDDFDLEVEDSSPLISIRRQHTSRSTFEGNINTKFADAPLIKVCNTCVRYPQYQFERLKLMKS